MNGSLRHAGFVLHSGYEPICDCLVFVDVIPVGNCRDPGKKGKETQRANKKAAVKQKQIENKPGI